MHLLVYTWICDEYMLNVRQQFDTETHLYDQLADAMRTLMFLCYTSQNFKIIIKEFIF